MGEFYHSNPTPRPLRLFALHRYRDAGLADITPQPGHGDVIAITGRAHVVEEVDVDFDGAVLKPRTQ